MTYDYLKQQSQPGIAVKSETPQLEMPTIELSENEYNYISRFAADQADPQKAIYDATSAILFSRQTGFPVDYCLQNLDILSQEQIGEKYQPTQTWWKSITNSYRIGELTIDRGNIGKLYAQARHNGEDFSQYEAQMKEIDSQILARQDNIPRSWITKALKATAESIPYTANITVARGAASLVGRGITALIPGIADNVAERIIEVLAGVAGTMKTSDIMWGSMYYDMINNGIDENVAWNMSRSSGVASGLIETFLEKLTGGVSRSVLGAAGITGGSVVNNLFSRMYANGSLNSVGLILTRIASTAVGEGSEEFVEEIKDKFFENLAYTLSDMEIPVAQDFQTKEGLRNNMSDALDSFVWGALSGIIMGAPFDVKNSIAEVKAATKSGMNLKTVAKAAPTYEVFSDYADNLRPSLFEGKQNDALWENAKQKIYNSSEAVEGRRNSLNAMGDIEESETFDENGNVTKNPRFYNEEGNYDEAKGASGAVTVNKMANGLYFSQDSKQTTAEGYSIRKFGNPEVSEKQNGKYQLYGQIEYTQDDNGITIENIKFKRGVSESDMSGMVRQFLQENPDINISWDATTDLERSIKEGIEKSNDGSLNFKSGMDMNDHQAVVNQLNQWMGDLGQNEPVQEAVDAINNGVKQTGRAASVPGTKSYDRSVKEALATVIQLLGHAEGKTGMQWLKNYIKEFRAATDEELGNKGGEKGEHLAATKTSLDETTNSIKATIYFGKKANYSSFEHELHHVVMMQAQHRAEFAKLFQKYKNDKTFRDFVAKSWSTFSGSFPGVRDIDQLLDTLFNKEKWSPADYEFEASLFEAYRAQNQSYKNKQLSSFFGKIASWMKQIYQSIRRHADLNPELAQFYDRLYGAEGKQYEGENLTFELRDGLAYTSESETAEDVLQSFKDTEASLISNPANFDAQGRHLAPNGKPSNLTYKQWVTVRTPQFIRWFGDWENDPENASKVVDENGEPLVVYHHTDDASFDVFRIGTGNYYVNGLYFMESESSTSYGDKYIVAFLNIRNPFDVGSNKSLEPEVKQRFIDAFMKRVKPTLNVMSQIKDDMFDFGLDGMKDWLISIEENMNRRNVANDILKSATGFASHVYLTERGKRLINDLVLKVNKVFTETTGIDGFAVPYKGWYVALQPNQIKSATDNSGEFSRENNSILFQSAPPVDSEEFHQWFDGSKIVDEQGKPLVVYHGSPIRGIEEFRPTGATNNGEGLIYATDEKTVADWFAKEHTEGSSAFRVRFTGNVGEVYPMYMDMKHPLDFRNLTDEEKDLIKSQYAKDWHRTKEQAEETFNIVYEAGNHQYLKDMAGDIVRNLPAYGYDGLIANMLTNDQAEQDGTNYTEYAVVRPDQVRTVPDEMGAELYQTVTNEDEIREIEKDGTIKLVRMMQIIDGKIYSPINNTWYDDNGVAHMSDPFELDVWYKAEEHPELAKLKKNGESYEFTMHKTPNNKDADGNKLDPVTAAYNPYMHGSVNWLNDQFKSVIRPNLVYVEIEMPYSDLNSGYHAEKAKDPVGPLTWKSGTVTSAVSSYSKKPRIVYLSRYMKITRIIPDSEVAPHIKEELNGLPMAIESVTPSLRAELEKIGVDFVPIENYTAIYGKKNVPGIEKISRWGKPYPSDSVLYQVATDGELENISVSEKADGSLEITGDVSKAKEILSNFSSKIGGSVKNGVLKIVASKARLAKEALFGHTAAYGSDFSRWVKDKDGNILGAPPQFNTPEKVNKKLMPQLIQLAREGWDARFWYEHSGEAFLQAAQGNVLDAERIAGIMALLSPQNTVQLNTDQGLDILAQYYEYGEQGIADYLKIKDMNGLPRVMGNFLKWWGIDNEKALSLWTGEKTRNFFQNLRVGINPNAGLQGSTNDLWIARALGYTSDAIPGDSPQYRFANQVIGKVAKMFGIPMHQVQAAIWTALQSRWEQSEEQGDALAVEKGAAERVSEKKIKVINGKENLLLHRDAALAFEKPVIKEFSYRDALRLRAAQMSWEAAPGESWGFFGDYYNLSEEDRVGFLKDTFDALLGENGIFLPFKAVGLPMLESVNAPGVWGPWVSPGIQTAFSLSWNGSKEKPGTWADLELDHVRTMISALGILLGQDGMGINRALITSKKKDMNGLHMSFPSGHKLTDSEAETLSSIVAEEFAADGFDLKNGDILFISDLEGGMFLVNNKKNKETRELDFDNKKFIPKINEAIRKFGDAIGVDEIVTDSYKHVSILMKHDSAITEEDRKDGVQGYLSWLREGRRSDTYESLYNDVAQKLYEVRQKYADRGAGEVGHIPTPAEVRGESSVVLNQTSEISDDTITEVVDSFIVDKSEPEALPSLTTLILSEMRHAIDYPQRDYNTVSTPSLLYNLRAVARASSDISDFMINAEENYGMEGQEFDLADLQSIWDDVHAVQIENRDYGSLTEPNRDVEDRVAQFEDILSDKASFEEFLKALQNSDLDGASLFINNLVSRLSGDNSLNTEGFRIAYGQVLENPEMYMDLYGQATDNEYWKSTAENGEIADELPDQFEPITRTTVNEVAGTIEDKEARDALLSGTETAENGAVEKALDKNKKTIEELLAEKRRLEEQRKQIGRTEQDVYDAQTHERFKAGVRESELKNRIADMEESAADLQHQNEQSRRLLINAQRLLSEKSEEFKAEMKKALGLTDEELAEQFPLTAKALDGGADFETDEDFAKALEDKNFLRDQISTVLQKYRQLLTAKKNVEVAEKVSEAKQSERYKAAIAQKNLRNRLEKVNEDLKKAYKERQALKKAKALKKALARKIMRPVSNNVNWKQARQIMKIQAQIDPNFTTRMRVDGKMMDIKEVRWLFTENPDNPIFDSLTEEQIAKILSQNLNDLTVEQLEVLAMVVDNLRAEGLRERQAYLDAQARVVQSWRDRFIAELMKTGKTSNNPPMKGSQEEAKQKTSLRQRFKNANYALLNMARKAQILDNHQKGAFYDLLIRKKREVFNVESRAVEKRIAPIEAYMKEHKIEWSDFYKMYTVAVDGWKTTTLSFSELLYFYLGANNEKNKQALAYGNLVTDEEKKLIKDEAGAMAFDTEKDKSRWMAGRVKKLGDARYKQLYDQAKTIIDSRPELKPVIEMIEADLNSEAFERVREIMLRVFNQEVGREEYYLPMRRNNLKGKSAEEMLYEDIMKTVPGTRASRNVKKGMTEDRIVIAPINQSSVTADFVKVWADSVADQEHLVAALEYTKLLNSVFGNSTDSAVLKSYITQVYGDAMVKDIDTHLAEIANPNAVKDTANGEDIIRYLRGSLYSAYLGFRTANIVNQAITSPAAFLGKVNIFKLMKGYLAMMAHPVQMWNAICELSPFMKSRSIDPTRQMIRDESAEGKKNIKTGNKAKDALNKVKDISATVFNDVGLKGLDLIDRFAVAGGWWAIYQDELSKLDGGNTEENQKIAAQKADEFVYETQPLSDKTELAPFFKEGGEGRKLLTAFQTSLNVVWNNITFDIPQQLGISGRNFKEKLQNGEFAHAIGMIVGYAVSGTLLLLVTEGFDDDDDDKDKIKKIVYSWFNQPVAAIPLVSNGIDYGLKRMITGEKSGSFSSNNYPLFDKMIRVPYNITEGDWDKAWKNAWQSIALANGLPYSAINDLLRIKDEGLGSLLGRRK